MNTAFCTVNIPSATPWQHNVHCCHLSSAVFMSSTILIQLICFQYICTSGHIGHVLVCLCLKLRPLQHLRNTSSHANALLLLLITTIVTIIVLALFQYCYYYCSISIRISIITISHVYPYHFHDYCCCHSYCLLVCRLFVPAGCSTLCQEVPSRHDSLVTQPAGGHSQVLQGPPRVRPLPQGHLPSPPISLLFACFLPVLVLPLQLLHALCLYLYHTFSRCM